LGGLVVGTLYAATVRYRQLWRPVVGALVAALVLYFVFGVGAQFVTRVTEGIQFQDQANQMRLNEYQNALQIIQRYPIFGIGFGSQGPDLDLGVGVSSIYLALAERVGLVGLFWFLGIIGAFFARGLPAIRSAFAAQQHERAGLLLSLQAAIVAALAVGLLDHYFFNIEFSHMVALFWGSIGLALVLETMKDEGGTMKTSGNLELLVHHSSFIVHRFLYKCFPKYATSGLATFR
jgi:O-antigen ligase